MEPCPMCGEGQIEITRDGGKCFKCGTEQLHDGSVRFFPDQVRKFIEEEARAVEAAREKERYERRLWEERHQEEAAREEAIRQEMNRRLSDHERQIKEEEEGREGW